MNNGYLNEIIESIQEKSYLFPRGGMTKTGIPNPQDADTIDMSALSGIREYNPSEYTFTALAGTKLTEINQMLTDNGQFLPFDPPLATPGATLGGTVGANLSGPMRYYYGGVRDFILGVQFLNNQGQLVRSGGKVVKNAAGFDIPQNHGPIACGNEHKLLNQCDARRNLAEIKRGYFGVDRRPGHQRRCRQSHQEQSRVADLH